MGARIVRPNARLLGAALAFAAAAAPARAGCPVINGEYWMDIQKDGVALIQVIILFTRLEGNVFSYTADGDENYHPADGVRRPMLFGERKGTVRFECIGNSLRQENQGDGSTKVWWLEFTPIGETRLRVETNLRDRSGIYTRRSLSPTRTR
jgi:hypothetical protein